MVNAIEKAKSFRVKEEEKSSNNTNTSGPNKALKRTNENKQDNNKPTKIYYYKAELVISLYGQEIHRVPTSNLASYIEGVVNVESPVHIEEIARRFVEAVGVKRVGSRIKSAIEQAANFAVKNGLINKRGDFFWNKDMKIPVVRDRSRLLAVSKKVQYIAPEEVTESLKNIVEASYTISKDELIKHTLSQFGIKRMTEQAVNHLVEILDKGIKSGLFVEDSGLISIKK